MQIRRTGTRLSVVVRCIAGRYLGLQMGKGGFTAVLSGVTLGPGGFTAGPVGSQRSLVGSEQGPLDSQREKNGFTAREVCS